MLTWHLGIYNYNERERPFYENETGCHWMMSFGTIAGQGVVLYDLTTVEENF